MSSIDREARVQDAVTVLQDRFALFYLGEDGASVQEMAQHLENVGFPPDVAMEAALRHSEANAP